MTLSRRRSDCAEHPTRGRGLALTAPTPLFRARRTQAVAVILCLFASASGFAPAARARFAPRTTLSMSTETKKATALPTSVKPGVVTGQALVDLLDHAQENGCEPRALSLRLFGPSSRRGASALPLPRRARAPRLLLR